MTMHLENFIGQTYGGQVPTAFVQDKKNVCLLDAFKINIDVISGK